MIGREMRWSVRRVVMAVGKNVEPVKLVKLSQMRRRNSFDCLILRRTMKHRTTPQTRIVVLVTVLFATALCAISARAQQRTPTANELLRSAKTIYVKSSSILVRPPVIESKLRGRSEFQQLGLLITRNPEEADLVLEVSHDLFTKYVFTVIDTRSNTVVASGKLSSLGGTVAGKVAKRFMKEVVKARAQPGP